MDERDARTMHAFGDTIGEIRRVDGHQRIPAHRHDRVGGLTNAAEQRGDFGQDFGQTHDRQFRHRK